MSANPGDERVAGSYLDSEENRRVLHRFLLSRLRNAQDAEDLAQDVYLRYYQLKRADTVRRPRSYLFRVAQNLVHEFMLGRQREKAVLTINSELSDLEGGRIADASAQDPGDELGDAEFINRVLMQIPPGYRRVLVMNKRDGMSCPQIGAVLGITSKSAEIYLARALRYARRARWR